MFSSEISQNGCSFIAFAVHIIGWMPQLLNNLFNTLWNWKIYDILDIISIIKSICMEIVTLISRFYVSLNSINYNITVFLN